MKPNILWFCSDQQRTDSLGCYGSSFMHTPNIDRLSASGVTFKNAYCQAPTCTPSRASFLTGRYPSTVHCEQNEEFRIPATERLLPKILSENGYVCGLSGKLHLSAVHPDWFPNGERRIDDGFGVFNWAHDSYDKWPTSQYQLWLASQGQKVRQDPIPDIPHGEAFFGTDSEYSHTKWCVDRAMDFIEKSHSHKKPFFFCCDVFDPHPPFDPPEDCYRRMCERIDAIPDCRYVEGELDNKPMAQKIKHVAKRYDFPAMDENERKHVKAAYYAQVENIDAHFGRILDLLDRLGERENTLIIYSADHGEMLGDHGMFTKGGFYYDELTRVPLILSWPGHLPAGMCYSGLAELIDIFPSILEMLGLEPSFRVQGKSIWKGLSEGCETPKEYVLCQSIRSAEMLRSSDYKIVRYVSGEAELYDLKNDPGEVNNVYDDPAYRDIKLQMLEALITKEIQIAEPSVSGAPGY